MIVGLFLACATRSAEGQSSPSGPEFRVNSSTTGNQLAPAVGVNPTTGEFAVVFRDQEPVIGVDGATYLLFDAAGNREATSGFQAGFTTGLGMAGLAPGGFVFFGPSGYSNSNQVEGGFISSTSLQTGLLASTNTGAKSEVKVAAAADGDYVVVWTNDVQEGSGSGIFGRRFAYPVTPLGDADFRINTTISGTQRSPSVARSAGGDFVVVWQSGPPGGGCCTQIMGQRFLSFGAPVATEFQISTDTSFGNYFPDVASDASGNFVVVWHAYESYYLANVLARRYSSSGVALGAPFRVNTYTTSYALAAKVTRRNGDFIVVWQQAAPGDGAKLGIFARRYAPDGSSLGAIFQVNSTTLRDQYVPAIASKPDGGFVVVWTTPSLDGDGGGVFGQKYCLGGDANGNGSVDVADIFYEINYLFAAGPPPKGCADVNGTGTLDVADVFYLINYLFASGPPPV
jgi:hypothetical protein